MSDPTAAPSLSAQPAEPKQPVAREALLMEAIALLREIDKHGVLSMATQKGAGNFVRAYDAAPPAAEPKREPNWKPIPKRGEPPVEITSGPLQPLPAAEPKDAEEPEALKEPIESQAHQIFTLRHERDLAIAHDTQPYPTAWAYEQACKSLETAKGEIARLRDRVERLRGLCKSYSGALVDCDYDPKQRDMLDALIGDMEPPLAAERDRADLRAEKLALALTYAADLAADLRVVPRHIEQEWRTLLAASQPSMPESE